MAKTKQQIISDIDLYLRNFHYRDCYVGITSEVESCLFKDHKVPENGRWIYRKTPSHHVACEIETLFRDAGMNGGAGGGDETSTIVYAYRKTPDTNP